MFNLTELNQWDANVQGFDITDVVEGGASGIDNVPLKQLANRTTYLKDNIGRFEGVTVKTITSVATSASFTRAEAKGKLGFIDFDGTSGATANIFLPPLSTMTDGDIVHLTVHQASVINKVAKILPNGSDNIIDNLSGSSTLYIHTGEAVKLVRVNSLNWLLIDAKGYQQRVGEQFFGYVQKKGMLLRDGSLKSRAEYPRLWEMVSGGAIPDVNWNADRGKFSTGDGATTFRLPDDRGYFERAMDLNAGVDSDRHGAGKGSIVGDRQDDEFRQHFHTVNHVNSGTANAGGGNKITSGTPGGSSSLGTYSTDYKGGSETRPRNVAKYPLIIY